MRRIGAGPAALFAGIATATATALLVRYAGRVGGRLHLWKGANTRMQVALQDAAHELGTSTSSRQAVQVIAEHALRTTRAFGAYVERIENPDTKSDVEVVAVAGGGCPPLGTRIPYPGSLTEEIIESGKSLIMTEVGAIGERMAQYLTESCHNCTGLIIPLFSGHDALGALVLLRDPEQPHFTRKEAAHVRALGDLVTAAFRRLLVIDELRESDGRFRQLADHLDEVIWLGAPDLSVRHYVSPAYEKLFGRSLESLYEHPRSPLEAIHPEDRERVERELLQLRHGGEYDTRFRIIRPDGEVRWVRSRVYPIRNERGEVYRVAGIMEDITEQKEAEEERERLLARELEAKAEVTTIMESITDAFYTLDREWHFTYLNHEAVQILRRSREELLGKVVWDEFPEVVGTQLETEYRRAMAEQNTAAFEVYYAPLDLWLDVRAYPSPDRLSVYYRDVTARKRLDEELRTRIEQLNALAALGQRALAETDQDALLAMAVEVTARELGVEFVELLELIPDRGELLLRAGTGWREGLVGHATISASMESMAGYTLLSAEPLITEDLRAETRFRSSWLLAEHGAVSGLSVIIQGRKHPWGALGAHTSRRHLFTQDDIFFLQSVSNILGQAIELRRVESERIELLEREREARAESERVRIEAERGRAELQLVTESRARLIRGFSHDVKNPLGAADGFLQLMEEGLLDQLTQKQREGVERARRAIGSALDLIGDLLTIARAESGAIIVEREPTDLNANIAAVVEEFQAQAVTKGLTLTARTTAEPLIIESDADRIRQVLGNLLSNAVKYTEHGTITVSVSIYEEGRGETEGGEERATGARPPGAGRWIAIAVTDTGPGIPVEQQEVIFREFARAEVRDADTSVGIGLYIGQRIAEALGGKITVQSEVGQGSTFILWLPLVQPDS